MPTDQVEAAVFETPTIEVNKIPYEHGRRKGIADLLSATCEAKMPEAQESPYSKFFWTVVSSAIAAVASGVIFGAIIYAKLERFDQRFTSLEGALAENREELRASVSRRYTSDDASRDRAGLQEQINATLQRLTINGDRIADLLVWRATIEERLRKGS